MVKKLRLLYKETQGTPSNSALKENYHNDNIYGEEKLLHTQYFLGICPFNVLGHALVF